MSIVLPRGWLNDEEQAVLRDLAAGKVVLEVGSYLGRSTVVMAKVAEVVVAVDTHTGNPEEFPVPPGGLVWTFPQFWQNLCEHEVEDRVIPIVGDFMRVAYHLRPLHFGLAFVDADHSYEATMDAGRLAAALVGPGAPVVFHDYDPEKWPGVVSAVDEMSGEWGPPILLAGTLARLPIVTAGMQPVPRSKAI